VEDDKYLWKSHKTSTNLLKKVWAINSWQRWCQGLGSTGIWVCLCGKSDSGFTKQYNIEMFRKNSWIHAHVKMTKLRVSETSGFNYSFTQCRLTKERDLESKTRIFFNTIFKSHLVY